ncbi:MAG: tetratricopeptide repeat protein [Magnetococcales bacterium]|nr:tetratricopeptide repeat protein [Magnetococcales bacterium]
MKIISFFSFKGGVGRTALLVNLATYWASLGRVVAIVDMDLAAPGISYSPLLEPAPIQPDIPSFGVYELLEVYHQEKTPANPEFFGFAPPSQFFRRMRPPTVLGNTWPQDGAVLVLPAGERQTNGHTELSARIENGIHLLPPKKGRSGESLENKCWRAFAKLFREDIEKYRLEINGTRRSVDLLLIDSRTGLPELLDISLGYLADHMVLVAGINQQNQEGLRRTLHSLRKDEQEPRIPFGQYGSTLTIAFSPIPTHVHDDQESLQALAQSQDIISKFRLPPPDDRQQPESLPQAYHLPYTTRLLHSDQPIYPSGGKDHPYIRVLLEIANRLESEKELQEEMRETEKMVAKIAGKPVSSTKMASESSAPSVTERDLSLYSTSTDKWYWPWFNTAENPEQEGWNWMSRFLNEEADKEGMDRLLDGLCASISLDQNEKRHILERSVKMGNWQRRELVRIFDHERQRVESLNDEFSEQLAEILNKRKNEWRSLLLEDRQKTEWVIAALDSPLKGNDKPKSIHSGERDGMRVSPPNPLDYEKHEEEEYRLRLKQQQTNKEGFTSGIHQLKERAVFPRSLESIKESCAQPEKTEDVEKACRKAIEQDDKNATLWFDLGVLLHEQLNRPKEAEEAYRHAIKLDSNNARVWNNLGWLLHQSLRRYKEAEKAYRRAIALDGKDALPWINLGWLLHQSLGRYKEAEKAYRRAIALDEKSAIAWNNLGWLLHQRFSRYIESEGAYRRAIELDNRFVLPWINLGVLLDECLHRYEEAETAYRRAIALNDTNAPLWNRLGWLLHQGLKHYEEAEQAYRRAIALDNNNYIPWLNLGWLLDADLNRPEEAEKAYRRAIELNENDIRTWINLGLVLSKHPDRHQEAEEVYRRAIELDEKDLRPWTNLGVLLSQHPNRLDEAEAAYRRAIELNDKNFLAWHNLGVLLLRLGRPQDAEDAFRRATEPGVEQPPYMRKLVQMR